MTSLLMMSDGWGLFCLLVLGLFLMLAVGFLWGDFCRRMRRHRLDVLSQRHPISWQILPLDSPEALRGLRIFNGFHKTLEAASEHLANNNRDAAKGIMDQYMTPLESKAFLRECEQRVYESRRELDMQLDLVRCREVKLEGQRTIFELTTKSWEPIVWACIMLYVGLGLLFSPLINSDRDVAAEEYVRYFNR